MKNPKSYQYHELLPLIRLITADSPRPSDPKLKALIEEWIKK